MAAKKKTSARRGGAKKTSSAKARKTPARKAAKSGKRTAAKKATAKRPASKGRAKKAAKPAGRKAPAGKAAARKTAPRKQSVGEGDYEASRAFLKDQANFVEKNKSNIPAMGRQAKRDLDGAEGEDLRAAESEAASHARE